jgi:hypothetical protein
LLTLAIAALLDVRSTAISCCTVYGADTEHGVLYSVVPSLSPVVAFAIAHWLMNGGDVLMTLLLPHLR